MSNEIERVIRECDAIEAASDGSAAAKTNARLGRLARGLKAVLVASGDPEAVARISAQIGDLAGAIARVDAALAVIGSRVSALEAANASETALAGTVIQEPAPPIGTVTPTPAPAPVETAPAPAPVEAAPAPVTAPVDVLPPTPPAPEEPPLDAPVILR
jgi:outer membrane biosynthesis protein TonB